jgi:hypothetical protein
MREIGGDGPVMGDIKIGLLKTGLFRDLNCRDLREIGPWQEGPIQTMSK